MSREEHPHQHNLIIPDRLPNGKFPRVKMWDPPGERNGPFPRIKYREQQQPSKRLYAAVAQISESLRENRLSGREKVAMEKKCRICPEIRGLTRHHLVPHSWFLSEKGARFKPIRNANANIVPLCVSCHQIIDGVVDPVGRLQKRAALREALGTNEVSFILQVRGAQWFEAHYPRDP